MPVHYEIDRARGLIRTRCVGAVRFAEVTGHFATLAADPACPPRLDVLLDLREMTSAPEAEQLRDVGRAIGGVSDRVRFDACAVVVPNDVLFGMLRMFAVFAEEHFRAVQVFRDFAEAESWLVARLDRAG